MPELPNPHAVATMVLVVVALILFSRDRIRLEITSFGLIVILAIGFSLFPFGSLEAKAFFEGFANEALLAVCALMVIGQGIVRTGALEPIGRVLARGWSSAPQLSIAATLIVGAALSAFINNTPIVVLLLPLLVGVSAKRPGSGSGVLMPMGFATVVGGMATTIGTSTNLLVVDVAAGLGAPRFAMFDFAYPAAIAAGVAILYLWLVAPRLLPERDVGLGDASPRLFEARLQLHEQSLVVGKTLGEAIAIAGGMAVDRIRRGDTLLMPLPDVVLLAGDRLRITDTPQKLKSYEQALSATLYTADQPVDEDHPLAAPNQMLAELAVVQGSSLDRANLRFAQFVRRHQLIVLALHRAGQELWDPKENIEDVVLEAGDVLLIQGPREQLLSLKSTTEFLVLDASTELPTTRKAPLALAILVAVVSTAALGILPIAVSAMAGAAAMLVSRCLSVGGAIRAISPSVYFVVVASLALGRALIDTGGAAYVTEVFLFLTSGAGEVVILGSLMLLLAVLTNLVSNNAAAVIGTPIGVGIAQALSLPAEPFVLAVLFGANMSFATPFAYQTNLLVMNAGGYRFAEFVKVGVPLILLMLITLTWVLSLEYL